MICPEIPLVSSSNFWAWKIIKSIWIHTWMQQENKKSRIEAKLRRLRLTKARNIVHITYKKHLYIYIATNKVNLFWWKFIPEIFVLDYEYIRHLYRYMHVCICIYNWIENKMFAFTVSTFLGEYRHPAILCKFLAWLIYLDGIIAIRLVCLIVFSYLLRNIYTYTLHTIIINLSISKKRVFKSL